VKDPVQWAQTGPTASSAGRGQVAAGAGSFALEKLQAPVCVCVRARVRER
jgi:hypothetical protein